MSLYDLLPSRAALAGGLSGLAAAGILAALAHFGVQPDAVVNTLGGLGVTTDVTHVDQAIAGIITFVATHIASRYLPPSVQFVAKHYDSVVRSIGDINVERTDPTKQGRTSL